jgi:hypothetical protein
MKHFRLIAVMVAATLAACTLIHLEGDGNTVTDIGGHSAKVFPPAAASSVAISQ